MGEEEGWAAGACMCRRHADQRRPRERERDVRERIQWRRWLCGIGTAGETEQRRKKVGNVGFGPFSEEKEGMARGLGLWAVFCCKGLSL